MGAQALKAVGVFLFNDMKAYKEILEHPAIKLYVVGNFDVDHRDIHAFVSYYNVHGNMHIIDYWCSVLGLIDDSRKKSPVYVDHSDYQYFEQAIDYCYEYLFISKVDAEDLKEYVTSRFQESK